MAGQDLYQQMIKISEEPSLLKYDLPFIVSGVEQPKPKLVFDFDISESPLFIPPIHPTKVEIRCAFHRQDSEECLDYLLPPREWLDDYNRLWRQKVATSPGTRYDAIHLRNKLNLRLAESNAQEYGICQARRALYRQCFDELIRQNTINCAERGIVLLRIRDEGLRTLAALLNGYQSALAYAVNKVLMNLSREEELHFELADLDRHDEHLEKAIEELEEKDDKNASKHLEEHDVSTRTHREEMEIQKRINQQVKQQLTRVLDSGRRAFF